MSKTIKLALLRKQLREKQLVTIVFQGKQYQFTKLLGEGGQAYAFLLASGDDKRVIKIESEGHKKSHHKYFKAEAHYAPKLSHPNLVKSYGGGDALAVQINGVDHIIKKPYTVMAYVEGKTLNKIVHSQRLSYKSFFKWMSQLVDVISYLHRQKIFICDVTPANMMICQNNGNLILIDLTLFGFNGAVIGEALPRQDIGAPELYYPYPNKYDGEVHLPNKVTDIFSLGQVFAYCFNKEFFSHPVDYYRQTFTYLSRFKMPKRLRRVMKQMLVSNPSKRPDIISVRRQLLSAKATYEKMQMMNTIMIPADHAKYDADYNKPHDYELQDMALSKKKTIW